jgi:hypothetical protein
VKAAEVPFNAYPNPARDIINLEYIIPEKEMVSMALYDITGRKIKEIVPGGVVQAGTYTVHYDSKGLRPGAYFIRLQAGNQAVTEKFIKLNP